MATSINILKKVGSSYHRIIRENKNTKFDNLLIAHDTLLSQVLIEALAVDTYTLRKQSLQMARGRRKER